MVFFVAVGTWTLATDSDVYSRLTCPKCVGLVVCTNPHSLIFPSVVCSGGEYLVFEGECQCREIKDRVC